MRDPRKQKVGGGGCKEEEDERTLNCESWRVMQQAKLRVPITCNRPSAIPAILRYLQLQPPPAGLDYTTTHLSRGALNLLLRTSRQHRE